MRSSLDKLVEERERESMVYIVQRQEGWVFTAHAASRSTSRSPSRMVRSVEQKSLCQNLAMCARECKRYTPHYNPRHTISVTCLRGSYSFSVSTPLKNTLCAVCTLGNIYFQYICVEQQQYVCSQNMTYLFSSSRSLFTPGDLSCNYIKPPAGIFI